MKPQCKFSTLLKSLVGILLVFVFFHTSLLLTLLGSVHVHLGSDHGTPDGVGVPVLPLSLHLPNKSGPTTLYENVQIKRSSTVNRIRPEDITVLIKTMDRQMCLHQLIREIRLQHPNIPIIVADDGLIDSQEAAEAGVDGASDLGPDGQPFVKYFRMPYDSGLSAGRNLMLSQVQTPYVLLLDDDFLWSSSVLAGFIEVMQAHPFLDLVGGRAGLDFAGLMHIQNDFLYLIKGNKGILEDTAFVKDGTTLGSPCVLVDFVPNFYLARTESLLLLQWDNSLKVGEHEEFFIRFNQGGYRVAYCTDLFIQNQQDACNRPDMITDDATRARMKNRGRARMFIKRGLYMHSLYGLAYCLGEEFVSYTWKRKEGPTPEHICHEVPLPEVCPTGWTGPLCDKCAPGFTSPNCNTCMPNRLGPKCEECVCLHGTCALTDQQQVTCKCLPDYYGPTCNKKITLGENLITDTTFMVFKSAELAAGGAAHWFPYENGCVIWAEEGIWMMNDGKLSCGVGYTIQLDQQQAKPILVSAESRAIGAQDMTNAPHWYALYIDLAFQDGTFAYGQFIGFSHDTHNWEYKEIFLTSQNTVKAIHTFVLFKYYSGSVAFRNVVVKEAQG